MSLVDLLVGEAKKTPYFHLDGYMHRYWIGNGKKARIHEILRSDMDRHRHDHPWDYTTIILIGTYIEEGAYGDLVCGPGTVLNRKAEDAHRLVLPYGPVTTLFIPGEWKQTWGFYTDTGKVDWRTYLGPKAAAEEEKLSQAWGAERHGVQTCS